jgi:hypothetical protein
MPDPIGPDLVSYRARPYVCGALGGWDTGVLQRLRSASPPGLREICRSPFATAWATGPLTEWRSHSDRGYFWGSLAAGAPPTQWRDAAQWRLAAGLQVTDQEAVLHTDGLGAHDLYYRRSGNALYFAIRIDPLVRMSDSPVNADWQAWVNILTLTFPVGDATPFQEVRRMLAATAWRAGRDGIRPTSFEPCWLETEPDSRVTPADAVDTLERKITSIRRRPTVLLSGGWDSRLLAAVARRRWRRIRAWTTSNDDGHDHDVAIARRVADRLQLTHRIFVPGPEAWLEERSLVQRRMEFQTTHHVWIMPLARSIHRQTDWILDGLAGDVLFKSLFVTRDLNEAGDPASRWRMLWNQLEQRRGRQRDLLAPGVAAALEARSREAFTTVVRRYQGHPAATTLAVLHTRTARGIAPSSQWLLGPEVEVRTPFLHPEMIITGLRVPINAKAGGDFYRRMLQVANPEVADLPSTNDSRSRTARGPLRQASPTALRAMARSIMADEHALKLLSPEMRLALRDPAALSIVGRSIRGLRLLQGLSLFAEWRGIYGSTLNGDGVELG